MKVDNGSGVFGVYMVEGVFGVNDEYERYRVDCVEGGNYWWFLGFLLDGKELFGQNW